MCVWPEQTGEISRRSPDGVLTGLSSPDQMLPGETIMGRRTPGEKTDKTQQRGRVDGWTEGFSADPQSGGRKTSKLKAQRLVSDGVNYSWRQSAPIIAGRKAQLHFPQVLTPPEYKRRSRKKNTPVKGWMEWKFVVCLERRYDRSSVVSSTIIHTNVGGESALGSMRAQLELIEPWFFIIIIIIVKLSAPDVWLQLSGTNWQNSLFIWLFSTCS